MLDHLSCGCRDEWKEVGCVKQAADRCVTWQMADLKENIEAEIHAAHDEYLKMDAHIKLYITEMDQAI